MVWAGQRLGALLVKGGQVGGVAVGGFVLLGVKVGTPQTVRY